MMREFAPIPVCLPNYSTNGSSFKAAMQKTGKLTKSIAEG
jgi:hypothetical protein